MSNSNHTPISGPAWAAPDEEALDDHPDRDVLTDPSCGPPAEFTPEEFDEMGFACETWDEQKRSDRRLAEERASRAAA